MSATGAKFKYEFFNYKGLSEETIDTDKTYFDMFKDLEEGLQKDIYAFNEEEFAQALSRIKSSSTLEVVTSVLRQYLEYAFKQKKIIEQPDLKAIIENNGLHLKIKNMEMYQGYIVGREELYHIVNNIIYNKRDAAIFVLLYEGLSNEEVQNLKINQVDFINRSISINSKVYKNIDKRTMQVVWDAIKETKYMDSNGKSAAKAPFTLLSDEGGFVIKVGTRSYVNRTYQVITAPIRSMQKKIGKLTITATRIRNSGMFDYIRTLENNYGRSLAKEEYRLVLSKYGYENDKEYILNNYIHKTQKYYNDFLNIFRPSDEDMKLFEQQHDKEEEIKENAKKFGKKTKKTNISKEKKRSQKADKNTWVDDNEKVGKKGETIVLKYLSETYGSSNVIDMNDKDDFDGYDILLMTKTITERIEVKTTRNMSSPIHISTNQLKVANKYKTEFCIYIVYNPYLKKDEELTEVAIKKSKIYKIENPIDFFEIDLKFLQKPILFKNCIFELEKFKLSIAKECIDRIEPLVFKENSV